MYKFYLKQIGLIKMALDGDVEAELSIIIPESASLVSLNDISFNNLSKEEKLELLLTYYKNKLRPELEIVVTEEEVPF